MDFQKIIAEFGIEGTVESASPFGSGHINDTMKIMVNKDGEKKGYILQRLNTTVFPDPDILMENGFKVVKHLKNIIEKRGGDPERETLRFYRTVDGKSYYQDEEGKQRLHGSMLRSRRDAGQQQERGAGYHRQDAKPA